MPALNVGFFFQFICNAEIREFMDYAHSWKSLQKKHKAYF